MKHLNIEDYQKYFEIMKNDSDNKDTIINNMFRNIYINSSDNELMIRDNNITKKMILARINLNHQHVGTGSKIIEQMIYDARSKGYFSVNIESILTIPMYQLAKKLGFHESNSRYSTGPKDGILYIDDMFIIL